METHSRDGGETALVFLHHFGGSGRTWSQVIARLENNFCCIAPDLRGFGDSAAPPRETRFAVDDYADDVAELVQARGLTRWVLVGHSMGGKIALALAARRPAGMVSLVLVAPSPPTPEPMTDAARAHLRASHGDPNAARAIVAMICGDRALPARLRERTVADMLCAAPAAWQAWLDTGSRENIAERMPAVAVPALVLAGERDPALPAAVLEREVVSRLTGASLTVVPGAGHLLPLEAPDVTARHVREAARA